MKIENLEKVLELKKELESINNLYTKTKEILQKLEERPDEKQNINFRFLKSYHHGSGLKEYTDLEIISIPGVHLIAGILLEAKRLKAERIRIENEIKEL